MWPWVEHGNTPAAEQKRFITEMKESRPAAMQKRQPEREEQVERSVRDRYPPIAQAEQGPVAEQAGAKEAVIEEMTQGVRDAADYIEDNIAELTVPEAMERFTQVVRNVSNKLT